ncbi:MAG: ribonuclease P protein component [Caldisericota bacterium]|nr:ribonuclease P protein component [Caldisericota bacterium]
MLEELGLSLKFSFPPEGRLGRKEFREVCRQGRAFVSPWMILYYKEDDRWGAGFGTTKEVRKAVERNRLRRRLKEAYRLLRPELAPNFKVVVIGKPKALELGFEELRGELEKLLKKANIFRGASPN